MRAKLAFLRKMAIVVIFGGQPVFLFIFDLHFSCSFKLRLSEHVWGDKRDVTRHYHSLLTTPTIDNWPWGPTTKIDRRRRAPTNVHGARQQDRRTATSAHHHHWRGPTTTRIDEWLWQLTTTIDQRPWLITTTDERPQVPTTNGHINDSPTCPPPLLSSLLPHLPYPADVVGIPSNINCFSRR